MRIGGVIMRIAKELFLDILESISVEHEIVNEISKLAWQTEKGRRFNSFSGQSSRTNNMSEPLESVS